MTLAGTRPPTGGGLSVAALKQALALVRDAPRDLVGPAEAAPTAVPAARNDGRDLTFLVAGAHGGAGTSTVALALAEALAELGWPVRLLDAATAPAGLLAASTADLPADDEWARGRRGSVEIVRVGGPAGPPLAVEELADPAAPLVVDLGEPLPSLRLAAAQPPAVLVCRATVPGLRHAEQLLDDLPAASLVAAVGPRHWPGLLRASCGPTLRAARRAGRVVAVPLDRRLELTGICGDPLPKPVLAAGRVLARLLTTSR